MRGGTNTWSSQQPFRSVSMSSLQRFVSPLVVVLALGPCAAVATSALAQDRINAELDKFTTMDFVKLSLKDVLLFAHEQHQIDFQLAPGVDGDTPITYKVQGVTLRNALNEMLQPHKLGFEVKKDAIVVGPLKK